MTVMVSVPSVPLVDPAVLRLAALPAGPDLHAALVAIDPTLLSGHDRVLYFAHCDRLHSAVGGLRSQAAAHVAFAAGPGVGERSAPDPHAAAEVRAAVKMSRQKATSIIGLAVDLRQRLPAVAAAWRAGLIDETRAFTFASWTQDLAQPHVETVVTQLLPIAGSVTPGRLAELISRLNLTLDLDWAQRRLQRGLDAMGVDCHTTPDGTATLTATGLPPDAVAAIMDRADAIARRLRAAGHPCRRRRLHAEIFLLKLHGRFDTMTDEQIYQHLLDTMPAKPTRKSAAAPSPTPESAPTPEAETTAEPSAVAEPTGAGGGVGSAVGRIAGRGLRLRVGLATLANRDQQPATLLGSGPQTPDLARLMAASTRATWHYVIRDSHDNLEAVGPIRVRPSTITTWSGTPPSYDIEVWVTTSRAELARLAKDPPPGWAQIIATITTHLASHPPGPPQGDPRARLPDARLRRWLAVRDGGCTFPANCPTPPQQTEADHTREYGKGGPTQDDNLACACVYDHHLRHDHGWNVLQLYPGCIVWISPLGHVYYHRPDGNQ